MTADKGSEFVRVRELIAKWREQADEAEAEGSFAEAAAFRCCADELEALQSLAPAGWRLVPVEPTERMVIDGFESRPDELFSPPEVWEAYDAMTGCQQAAYEARLCWAAMLAASPTPQPRTDAGGETK